ncbi:MAG: epoxyqueuosine reductase QueH [Oscillospiraceae bacterium]|nr:epoxyqueuosine reductase QueH [Oscillospiraceae bacterium]
MKTLLHICCAPCANQCIDALREEGIQLTGFWYNPNIHPYTENRSRRETVEQYCAMVELPLVERNEYALRPFLRAVAQEPENRCVTCYTLRLEAAAAAAEEGGFDSFTSSLFISPYQKHDLMREIAEEAAFRHGVQFLYRDFRPRFRAGQERARELGLYMQKYCGCIYSEEERYRKAGKIIP